MRLPLIERRIGELEDARRGTADPEALAALLDSLDSVQIDDGRLLARFHDALLFLCAYPPGPRVLRQAESLLQRFGRRVERLERRGDIAPLLDPEVSGIAETSIETAGFSFEVVRWLQEKFPRQTAIDWESEPATDKLVSILTPLIPFLAEVSNADANVGIRQWLASAGLADPRRGLAWIVESLERIAIDPNQLAALFDSIHLGIRWSLGGSAMSRTRMRSRRRAVFFQRTPPLPRREVSLARELASPHLRISKLAARDGEALLARARAAIAVRYRELYSFTWGDARSVICADAGRGLEIFVVGILPRKRLPLRAGFGAFFVRNGVPTGYADAFGVCERMDVSFNIFYAFRDGESAYCFARLLKLYRQLFGSSAFSIDSYQLGVGNEEAIKAGAFWFYRKLGFRSIDPGVESMARREEERMSADPRHRTSETTLRKMARSPIIYDANGSSSDAETDGEWDHFDVRNVGLAVQRDWSHRGGSSSDFVHSCVHRAAELLDLADGTLPAAGRTALAGLAPVLMLARIERWSAEERALARRIVRAKAALREGPYLRLLAQHRPLRRALLSYGTPPRPRHLGK